MSVNDDFMPLLYKISASRFDKELAKAFASNPYRAEKLMRMQAVHLAHRGMANGVDVRKLDENMPKFFGDVDNVTPKEFKENTRKVFNYLNKHPIDKTKKDFLYKNILPQRKLRSMLIPDTKTNRLFLRKIQPKMYSQKPEFYDPKVKPKLDKKYKYYSYGSGYYTDDFKFNRKNRYLNSPTNKLLNTKEKEMKPQLNGQFADAHSSIPGKEETKFNKSYAHRHKLIGDIPIFATGEIGTYGRSAYPEYKEEIILKSFKNKHIEPAVKRISLPPDAKIQYN